MADEVIPIEFDPNIERLFAPEDEDELIRDQRSNEEHETEPGRVIPESGDQEETQDLPEAILVPDQSRKIETGPADASQERFSDKILPGRAEFHELIADFSCLESPFVEALNCMVNYIIETKFNFFSALFTIHRKHKLHKDKIITTPIGTKRTRKYVVMITEVTQVFLSGIHGRHDAYNAVFEDQPKCLYLFCCNFIKSLIQPFILNPKCLIIVPWAEVSKTFVCSHGDLTRSIATHSLYNIFGMLGGDEEVFLFDGDNVGNLFEEYISSNLYRKTIVFCNKTSYGNQIQRILMENNERVKNVVPYLSNSFENAADCDIIRFVCFIVNFFEYQNRRICIYIFSKDKIFKKLLRGRDSELLIPKRRNSLVKILFELPTI